MEELHLPIDAQGFSRRECPRCKARFKLRATPGEAATVAGALGRRVQHENGAEAAPPGPRTCPYCAFAAPAEEFLPPEVQRRLDEAARGLEAEVRSRRLRVPPEWIAENPRVDHGPVPPARLPPTVRQDRPDDLVRIALPCCGEEQKVSDAWLGPIRCHLCGVAHLRAGPRDFGLELALLKQWAGEG